MAVRWHSGGCAGRCLVLSPDVLGRSGWHDFALSSYPILTLVKLMRSNLVRKSRVFAGWPPLFRCDLR